MFGLLKIFFKQFDTLKDLKLSLSNFNFWGNFVFFHFLSYIGAFSANKSIGISATLELSKIKI